MALYYEPYNNHYNNYNIEWNLRIKDNLGPGILSLVRRLVSLGGQPIFSLKMPSFMLLQVYHEELDLNFYYVQVIGQ